MAQIILERWDDLNPWWIGNLKGGVLMARPAPQGQLLHTYWALVPLAAQLGTPAVDCCQVG
jgi:hypothetical protein